MNTNYLFPIPVSTKILPDSNIMDFVNTIEFIPYIGGNGDNIEVTADNCHLMISKDKQVLDTYTELAQLRQNIFLAAEVYWRDVIGVDSTVSLKIMHSWFTRHDTGGKHWNRPHSHSSSIITSTMYLQTAEGCGNLIFNKNIHYLNLFPMMIDLDYITENQINSTKFSITPKNNLIVFFPSHLEHYTESNKSTVTRFTLNVDWWFEGLARKNVNSYGFESIY